MDLGCLGFAGVDTFFVFFGPTFFAGFLTASVFFGATAVAILFRFGRDSFVALAVLSFTFFAASANLYEALILTSFPLAAWFFSCRPSIFLKFAGSTALCFSSMYFAIAYGLDPPFSFRAIKASLIIYKQ